MELVFDAPPNHVLDENNQRILGGEKFTVTDETRALELLTDPNVNVREAAPSNLTQLTREQLDELAEQAGLDPSDFKNKDAVVEALKNTQPEAAGAGHEPNQED